MKKELLRKKAALLRDRQRVEIDGLIFSARRTNAEDPQTACLYCSVDSLCKGDVEKVCTELDFISKSVWYLHLES